MSFQCTVLSPTVQIRDFSRFYYNTYRPFADLLTTAACAAAAIDVPPCWTVLSLLHALEATPSRLPPSSLFVRNELFTLPVLEDGGDYAVSMEVAAKELATERLYS